MGAAPTWSGDTKNPPSLHKYLYAYSNPFRYTDPTGHAAVDSANTNPYAAVADMQRKQEGCGTTRSCSPTGATTVTTQEPQSVYYSQIQAKASDECANGRCADKTKSAPQAAATKSEDEVPLSLGAGGAGSSDGSEETSGTNSEIPHGAPLPTGEMSMDPVEAACMATAAGAAMCMVASVPGDSVVHSDPEVEANRARLAKGSITRFTISGGVRVGGGVVRLIRNGRVVSRAAVPGTGAAPKGSGQIESTAAPEEATMSSSTSQKMASAGDDVAASRPVSEPIETPATTPEAPVVETGPITNSAARRLVGPNRGVVNVLENTSKKPAAAAYEDAVPGAYTDVATGQRVVPALRFTNPNPRGTNFVRFDGRDGMRLIDRKLNLTTKSKQIQDLQRMSEALSQNHPEYQGVIQVPSEAARRAAQRALQKAGVNNISIEVVP